MNISLLTNTQCFLALLLVIVAMFGDYMVAHRKLQLAKAILDNATHAIIGGLSWTIVSMNYRNHHSWLTMLEIFLCTFVSSFIDLDHFFAAQSIYLKDATNLGSRPPLHSSTMPLVTAMILFAISNFWQLKLMLRFSLLMFTAFASHHTRDATRRGYWFAPFGSTPPIPYYCYIVLTICIPYVVCFILKCVRVDHIYTYSSVQV